MLTKEEKKQVVSLAEDGRSSLEIAETLLINRGPKMFVRLNDEITEYLWELEENNEVIKNE
jgi:hypothetical protein